MTRFFVVFGLFLCVAVANAKENSRFQPAGEMTAERSGHTATLLADGRVLLAGGYEKSSAEVYDPASGRFIGVGEMDLDRTGHSATLLNDGRVLIVGGIAHSRSEGSPYVASALLYDATTGRFEATGSLKNAQAYHAAALLPDGRVLIAGGTFWIDGRSKSAPAEIYDPVTQAFAPAPSYAGTSILYDPPEPGMVWPQATVLKDGRVLFVGNYRGEIFDPATGAFAVSGAMAHPENQYGTIFHTATSLHDGKVLVAGGRAGDWVAIDGAEVFDPLTATFSRIAPLSMSRELHTATLLADGSVLIAGGATWVSDATGGSFGGGVASAERYVPEVGRFVPAGNMTAARSSHTATLLRNGSVLIAGGFKYYAYPTRPTAQRSAELYVPTCAKAMSSTSCLTK